MTRRKALPEELDPRVREFVEELRRLADGNGLSAAELADRTGYGRTSWERYLDGRLLAPKGAVLALAEATGTGTSRLTALWERAEHAWRRAETHQDLTLEALRMSRGRPAPEGPAPPAGSGTPHGAGTSRRRRLAMFCAGVAGALLVSAVMYRVTGGDDGDAGGSAKAAAASGPSATASATVPSPAADPPPGVGCRGTDCTGKDPEKTGCGGPLATSTATATVGTTLVELRYSATCDAVWARITRARLGDVVEVSAGATARHTASVTAAGDTDAYTPMIAVGKAFRATACVVPASGGRGCTK
ncbi:DUF2690 domain-containing protein [Streptomyces sp. NPDC048664]|uniref:helix-turn-helix domain-containing protein n=1 Tax=Streptomyces sp. NPDC048664 TaxID=3154505 RepID=UPI003449D4AA